MSGASEQIALEELAPWIARLGDKLARLDLTRTMKGLSLLLESDTKKRFETGTAPDGSPWQMLQHPRVNTQGNDLPLRDRGLLAASLSARGKGHVETLTSHSLEWGTNLEYAALMNYGGTVLPVRGKMLSIPLTKEAKRAGNARDFPRKLFVWERTGGTPMLAEQDPNDKEGKPIFHYVLVPKVTIPARPFLGISPEFTEYAQALIGEEVERQLGWRPPGMAA